ncbi:MAG: UbiA family prenyltransferase [Flavobacteriales bacterium]|nr:UbiA family prenyltransferase [Flavobacteriales bacterium]
MHWFNLIRWPNLIIILIMMLIGGWVLHILYSLNFILLVGSVICSAAAGNVWNDLNDLKADQINKPHRIWIEKKISIQHALLLYGLLNGLAIIFSLILFFQGFSSALIITLIAQILLFIYSILLKRLVVIGNFVISLLAWMSFLLLILYNKNASENSRQWVMHLGLLAFFTTWIREAIKDMQDVIGDREANYKTLPVIWPAARVKVYILFVIMAYLCYVGYYFINNFWLVTYANRLIPYIMILILPVFWIVFYLFQAQFNDQFRQLGNFIKVWMIFGMLSTLIWKGIIF